MSDTSVFLLINGLAGKVAFVDELFKGLANDYFLPVITCFTLVALWFGTRDVRRREVNLGAIFTAAISIGLVNGLVGIVNCCYFRARPFTEISPESINLLFPKPTDSSFPSNFAAVLFAIAIAILFKNRKAGIVLLSLALLGGFARVYVGIHYPLDILGGAAFGILAGFMAYGLSRLLVRAYAGLLGLMRKVYLA